MARNINLQFYKSARIKGRIKKYIFLITHNLRLFFKLVYVKILSLFFFKTVVRKNVNGVLFEFDLKYDAAIRYMYINEYEKDMTQLLRNVLKKGGIFIDAGANIGYLSAYAAGLVGTSGQVHSFEPVPQYYNRLEKIAELNPGYNIVANRYALGEENGKRVIKVTSLPNIGWNTMVPGLLKNEKKIKERIEVPVRRLDEYIEERKLENILLVKVDVEGFEFPVLKGLSNYFKKINPKPVIICEINPYASGLLGYSLYDISGYMKEYGYKAYSLTDRDKETGIISLEKTTDILFR